MNERIMTRGFPWGEPAHPGIVRQYEDLILIYRAIRDQMQARIDRAFDQVSRQIGYVVTTTIPVVLELSQDHAEAKWSVSEAFKGSAFDKALIEAVAGPRPEPWKSVLAGKYSLYLLWRDALKLRLRKDWLEPVHVGVRPEVQEPAHWFTAGELISAEEKLVISVIDEVYPELRLADRIAMSRQASQATSSRPGLSAELALREIAQIFMRVRPDIMEPAHFRLSERDILAEVEGIVRKYGG